MELDKLYQLNVKVSRLKLFFSSLILLLIILFSFLGLTFISFILSILFFFRVYRVILKFKRKPAFFKIKKNETNNSNEISFYDSKQKLLIHDLLTNFIFYKKRNKIFEIEHMKLRKNICLTLEGNTNMIYNFVVKENLKMKNPRRIGSFWEIVELIFMP